MPIPNYSVIAADADWVQVFSLPDTVESWIYTSASATARTSTRLKADTNWEDKIVISTTNVAHLGEHTVTINLIETFSGIEKKVEFKLKVICVTDVNTVTDPLWTAINYFISKPEETRAPAASFSVTPAGCPNQLSYVVTLGDGSALPNPKISFADGKIKVYETNFAKEAYWTGD